MKRLAFALFAGALLAQTPTGTVTVTSSIVATGGTLSCAGTATVGATTSVMQMKCMDGADIVLPDTAFPVVAPGNTVISVGRGTNTVTWLLSKGNPTPDRWEVSANGVMKSGTF